jgi:predicted Na+-dependent transporter
VTYPDFEARWQAVRTVVQQAIQPLIVAQVATRFRGSSAKKVQPRLDTLALMSLLRFVEEETPDFQLR